MIHAHTCTYTRIRNAEARGDSSKRKTSRRTKETHLIDKRDLQKIPTKREATRARGRRAGGQKRPIS